MLPQPLRSILLIDDNEDDNFIHVRQLLRSGLVEKEEHIPIATNGEEALALLQQGLNDRWSHTSDFPPQLIFIDINMPRMNGFELLDSLSKLSLPDRLKDSPMYILSSSTSPDDIARSKQYPQLAGYCVKPLDKEQLSEIVQRHFG